jgi:hypothetical protein
VGATSSLVGSVGVVFIAEVARPKAIPMVMKNEAIIY